MHDTLDEGKLTRKRSNAVNNSNLLKLAARNNLQVYIRDQPFDPCQFFALGRRCPKICRKETERTIHSEFEGCAPDDPNTEVRCSKGHHWLHKKTIADVVEALVGAFIVDSGFKAATAFLRWIGIQVEFEASQVTNICILSKTFLPLTASLDMATIESRLGHPFRHRGLLLQAFLHPSYNRHGGGCYQRLEFLGDAVLDYLITSYLFSVYPKLKPGQLTDLRSVLVNNQAFANVAVDRSLYKFLIFDSNVLSEAVNNYVDHVKALSSTREVIEGPRCPKVLGDVVESSVGAILLDTGFNLNSVWKIMLSFLDPILKFSNLQLSPIRELQELCNSHDLDLQFPTSVKGGKCLAEAKVTWKDKDVCITASALNLNKKEAEKIAAQQLFSKLKTAGYMPKTKSLESILKSCPKFEARLIGYDETPINTNVADDIAFKKLKIIEPFSRNYNSTMYSDSEASGTSPSITLLNRHSFPFKDVRRRPSEITADSSCDIGSPNPTTGVLQNSSARSRLYELCAANCWKPPSFDCYKEEGLGHLKMFTFRVIVEIEAPDTIIECIGAPQGKKKAAAEHAAEGALWCLEREGNLY